MLVKSIILVEAPGVERCGDGNEPTELVPYSEPAVYVLTLVQVLLTLVYDSVTDPISPPSLVPPSAFSATLHAC